MLKQPDKTLSPFPPTSSPLFTSCSLHPASSSISDPPPPMVESGLGFLADLSCSGPVVSSAAPSCTLKHQLVNQTSERSSELFAASVRPHRHFLPLTVLVRTLQRHTANHIPNLNHNINPESWSWALTLNPSRSSER